MDSIQTYAQDMHALVGILEGALVHSARTQTPGWIGMELAHGESKQFPDLPIFKVTRKTKEEEAKNPEKPYILSCTSAGAQELRDSFLVNNLPELPKEIILPGLAYLHERGLTTTTTIESAQKYPWLRALEIPFQPRLAKRTIQECWMQAQNWSPIRLRGPAGVHEYPPDVMAAAIFMIECIMADPDLAYRDVFADLKTSLECTKYQPSTCQRLVEMYHADMVVGGFDPTHPDGHLQIKEAGNPRQRARVLIEFYKFFGHFPPRRIGEAQVQDFITYLVTHRQEENADDRILDRDTIIKNLEPISGLCILAVARGAMQGNPFFKHARKVKSRFHKAKKKGATHMAIKHLRRILKIAYETDKQMLLAMVLGIFLGLRRCELLDSLNSAVDLPRNVFTVTEEAAKGNTNPHPVFLTEIAFMWLSLFEFGPGDEPILGPDIKSYADRWRWIRWQVYEGVEVPEEFRKDPMRKNFSINMQWTGIPVEFQKMNMGHRPNTTTLQQFYHGPASVEWAEAFLHLTPESILGFKPEKITYAERIACNDQIVPRPWIKLRPQKAKKCKNPNHHENQTQQTLRQSPFTPPHRRSATRIRSLQEFIRHPPLLPECSHVRVGEGLLEPVPAGRPPQIRQTLIKES